MIVKLLTEHHFEFLCLKGGCRGSSESTLVKMSNCWKPHTGAKYHVSLSVLDHSPLLDEDKKEGEWAIRIAQHLLSKLSVHRSYVKAPYSGCKFESTCPCPLQDNLVGYSGDTSFGM